jgi:hypothetical protein
MLRPTGIERRVMDFSLVDSDPTAVGQEALGPQKPGTALQGKRFLPEVSAWDLVSPHS